MGNTVRVETWNVRQPDRDERGRFAPATSKARRRARVVVRSTDGTFHGATNFRQTSRVGQVAHTRRG